MEKYEDSRKIYDAFAPQYRKYSESKSAYLESVDGLLLARFGGKVRRVLDYGAGDGVRGARLFRALGAERLVQADVSEEMLGRCREQGAAAEYWNVTSDDWKKTPERFDLILCLWNVLGHIRPFEERRKVLADLRSLAAPGARLCFDVNNRHYVGYGKWTSLARRVLDFVRPDYSRGDTRFMWEIGDARFPAQGHLFVMAEIRELVGAAGWTIEDWKAVDYATGRVSGNPCQGQLFFILR